MKTIIWRAVSSAAQARADKASLDTQLAVCEDYCRLHGLTDLHTITSTVSRSSDAIDPLGDTKNPAYAELVDTLSSGDVENFVYDRHDRIARDYLLAVQVARVCFTNNVVMHEASTGTTHDKTSDPLIFIVNAYQAHKAVRDTSARSIMGRIKRNQLGRFTTFIPYGYGEEYNSDGTWARYVNIPDQQQTVLRIFDLYMQNNGLRSIMIELGREGKTFSRVELRNILFGVWKYAGYVIIYVGRDRGDRQNYPMPLHKNPMARISKGLHDAIIDDDYARLIEAEIIRRGKHSQSAKGKYALSGVVVCKYCKQPSGTSRYNISTGYGYTYRCDSIGCEAYRKGINHKVVAKAIVDQLKSHRERLDSLEDAEDHTEENSSQERIQAAERQLKAEDTKLLNAARKFLDNGNEQIYNALEAEIEERKQQIENHIEELKQYEPPPKIEDRKTSTEYLMEMFLNDIPPEANVHIREVMQITWDFKTKTVEAIIDL